MAHSFPGRTAFHAVYKTECKMRTTAMCQSCAREKRRATPKTIPRKALNWGALARFGCAQEREIDKPELLASGITNHAAGAGAGGRKEGLQREKNSAGSPS